MTRKKGKQRNQQQSLAWPKWGEILEAGPYGEEVFEGSYDKPPDREIVIVPLLPVRKSKRKQGRRAKSIYTEALKLKLQGFTYPQIASRLDPTSYKKNPRNVAEKIREGVERLKLRQ